MKLHPYFRVLPRIRLYVARPMRAGCFASSSIMLAALALGILALVVACHSVTAPCLRGAPVLSATGDTLGYVCTNYHPEAP